MRSLLEHFEFFVEHYGLIALFVTVFLETVGLPLPGESVLVTTSAIAANGGLNILTVAITGIIAAVAGDNLAYFIGRRFGRELILKHGSRFGVTDERYRKVEEVTQKYGAYIVVIARFVVLLRQLNGLVAGSVNMNWHKFFIANVIGSTLWVLFWTTLSYQFGQNVSLIPTLLHHSSLVAAVVVLVLLLMILIFYLRLKRGV